MKHDIEPRDDALIDLGQASVQTKGLGGINQDTDAGRRDIFSDVAQDD